MYLAQATPQVQASVPGVTYPPPVKIWSSDMEKPTSGKGRENGVYYAMSNSIFKSLMQSLPGYTASDFDSPGALKDQNAIAWYHGMKNSFNALDAYLKTGGTIGAAMGPPTGPDPSGGTSGTFPGFKAAIQALEKILTDLQNKAAEMSAPAAQQASPTPQPAPMAIAPTAAAPVSQAPTMYYPPQAPVPAPQPIRQAGMFDDISPVAIAALFVIPLVVQLLVRRR